MLGQILSLESITVQVNDSELTGQLNVAIKFKVFMNFTVQITSILLLIL